eukprot:9656951-Alexandrium_andersonii.AAC.1
MQPDDAVLFRRVLMGGLWNRDIMRHLNPLLPDVCPWCQEEGSTETAFHLFCQCPKFADIRAKWWPEGLPCFEQLPPALTEFAAP